MIKGRRNLVVTAQIWVSEIRFHILCFSIVNFNDWRSAIGTGGWVDGCCLLVSRMKLWARHFERNMTGNKDGVRNVKKL